jgi:hypothetical protein
VYRSDLLLERDEKQGARHSPHDRTCYECTAAGITRLSAIGSTSRFTRSIGLFEPERRFSKDVPAVIWLHPL